MPLPNEIKESLDEIKTPSNRVLIYILIFSVISLAGGVVHLYRNINTKSLKESRECREEVLQLKKELDFTLLRERESNKKEAEYFKKKFEIYDSIQKNLKKINK